MKAKNIIRLLVCSLTSILISCSESLPYSEDAYNKTKIAIYPSSISLEEGELSGEFRVNSSGSWYVYDKPSWINISTTNGNGFSDLVSFAVDENDGSSNRSGNIRIRTDEGFTKVAMVEVSQPPTIQFDAMMSKTNFDADDGYWFVGITASASKSWTITKSVSWIHFGNSSNSSYTYYGSGYAMVDIFVDANPYSTSRSTTLTVKCGTKTKEFKITQAASSAWLNVDYDYDYFFKKKDDIITLTISTSSSQYWTISSNCTWLSFSKTSGTGPATVVVTTTKANNTGSTRYATITVKAGAVTKTIEVYQYGV